MTTIRPLVRIGIQWQLYTGSLTRVAGDVDFGPIIQFFVDGEKTVSLSAGKLITPEHCNISGRGRVVKASDSKSDSLWERRFESYRPRGSSCSLL